MYKKIMILGKPNVGKSSLFNAIIGKQKAVVNDYEGLTRDLNKQNFFIDDTLDYIDGIENAIKKGDNPLKN